MLRITEVLTDFLVGHYIHGNNLFATKHFNWDYALHSSHIASSQHRCHRGSRVEEKSMTFVKVNSTDLQNHTHPREERTEECSCKA